MFKNYFLLNRHVLETSQLLKNFIVESIFTQEKDKLLFELRNEYQKKYVEISVDPSLPYFVIKEKHSRAKKNTLDFFHSYLPAVINSIKVAVFDRIIQFNLNNAVIYFYIHGQDTNIFLINNQNNLESFKKIRRETDLITEINNIKFTHEFILPNITFEKNHPEISLKQNLYLGKEIIGEFERRSKQKPSKDYELILNEVIGEINDNNPLVIHDSQTSKTRLSFFSEEQNSTSEFNSFEKVNEALIYYISEIQKQKTINHSKNIVTENYEKKLKNLERKITQLKDKINAGSSEQKYQQIADLLSVNAHTIKSSDETVEVENIYDNHIIITIRLNKNLSLRVNIEYYYNKAKLARKEFESQKMLLRKFTNEYSILKSAIESNELIERSKVQSNMSKTNNQKTESQKRKFRQFILYDKYSIFVGKSSKNNDELTTGFAKQNDYWFHARSVSGSHVILRYEKSMGEIQKNILVKAASVAAFYSKAKTSGLVPVSYTQKKYVIKRKGMEPGKVYLLKEKVLIVKPEIPSECKLISEELI